MALVHPAARLFTCDIGIFQISKADVTAPGVYTAGTANNLLGIFQSSSIRLEFDTVNAVVPTDIMDTGTDSNADFTLHGIHGFVENVNTRGRWSVQLGTLLEKTAAPFVLIQMALAPGTGTGREELDMGAVLVEIFFPGGAGATSNLYGLAFIEEATFRGDLDGVIMQSGTLRGCGILTETA